MFPSPTPLANAEAGSWKPEADLMTHAQLVEHAVRWLRSYRCGVVLSEQACVSGEMPDAIGWKRANHSVLVECKITRADFLADRAKPFRSKPERGVGCERFYLTPANLLRLEPQSITDFLKWKNRMAEYNRGSLPEGLTRAEEEINVFLEPETSTLS